MIDESTMYWLTRCDAIHAFLLPVIILALMGACMATIAIPMCLAEEIKQIRWVIALAVGLWVLAFLLGAAKTAIPTTKEMVAIKVIPMIANNEDLKGLGEDTVKLAREWLEELRPKKKAEIEK